MMTSLTEVRIGTESLARTADVYAAISGGGPAANGVEVEFPLQDATLALHAAAPGEVGVSGITLTVPDLLMRQRALVGAGIETDSTPSHIRLNADQANGLAVTLEEARHEELPLSALTARLDHVALRVRNLDAASAIWETITGVSAQQMGVHPISGGAFKAARILLGERMIELIAPVPGVESGIAARLASHGEGVAALALPVDDVDAVRARLADIEVRVIWQAPHWMVHPKDAGGVLVQLTPRVAH